MILAYANTVCIKEAENHFVNNKSNDANQPEYKQGYVFTFTQLSSPVLRRLDDRLFMKEL